MQKNYILSCCSECPAFVKGNDLLCRKEGKVIDSANVSPADIVLLGFPEWCPLTDSEYSSRDIAIDYRRIAKQVLKRLSVELDDDLITSTAYYLSTVVNIKESKI